MENDVRLTWCHFIQTTGMKIRLPQVGIATAIVYFHRFYARNNTKDYPPSLVAPTCLFLAGKVVDSAVKLSVVIETSGFKFATKQDYEAVRDQVLMTERAVLKAIGFDFNSQHPYRYVVHYVKNLNGSQELLQIAWNWVNDSLKTTLCLHYRPEQIASAAVLLSAKLMRSTIYKTAIEHPDELFCDEKLDVLEEIYVQILDLYENCSGVNALKRRRVSLPADEPTPQLKLIKPPPPKLHYNKQAAPPPGSSHPPPSSSQHPSHPHQHHPSHPHPHPQHHPSHSQNPHHPHSQHPHSHSHPHAHPHPHSSHPPSHHPSSQHPHPHSYPHPLATTHPHPTAPPHPGAAPPAPQPYPQNTRV